MRVAFFGTSEFAVPALRALARSTHMVGLVVAAPAQPSGRGRRLIQSPVEKEARTLGLVVATPENPNDPSFIAQLASFQPDVAVLAAYGFILKTPLLRLPRDGFLNIHPSLLPRLRGAAPIQRAILAGEQETGVTVIVLSEQVAHRPGRNGRRVVAEACRCGRPSGTGCPDSTRRRQSRPHSARPRTGNSRPENHQGRTQR